MIKVLYLGERGVVRDRRQANLLYQKGCFGEFENNKLILSKEEILYLLEDGKINLVGNKGEIGLQEFLSSVSEDKEWFMKYLVYKDLRRRGYIVKTGLKFGADFRVYERGERPPDHSKYLVLVIPEERKFMPNELTRIARLAHSVRKRLWIAIVDKDSSIVYYEVLWKKP